MFALSNMSTNLAAWSTFIFVEGFCVHPQQDRFVFRKAFQRGCASDINPFLPNVSFLYPWIHKKTGWLLQGESLFDTPCKHQKTSGILGRNGLTYHR